MRIAFDTFNISFNSESGNKTYTLELIKALSSIYKDDHFFLPTYWRKSSKLQKEFHAISNCQAKGVLPHPKLLGTQLEPVIKFLHPFFQRSILKSYNIFHCTNPTNFSTAIKSVVTTIHDLIALKDEPWVAENSKKFYKENINKIVNESKIIFASSNFTKMDLLERFPNITNKIVVVPLAASSMFQTKPKDPSFLLKYGISDNNRPYFLTVGTLQPRKNFIGVIDAFSSISSKYRDFNLIIIGQVRNHNHAQPIFDSVNKSIARDRIYILENVTMDNLVDFYNNAFGFLYYSFFEGFGLPIIEAMQCGCPVAAGNNSSMTEIAKDAAILVDANSIDSMRDGILQLIENESLKEHLRSEGFRRAKQFSWEKTAELTYGGYKKIA